MSSVKRSKHGVTVWQPDKAFAGYTLFCPLYTRWKQLMGEEVSRVYLIDMKGDIVHYWTVPGLLRFHAELLPNGNILCAVDQKEYAHLKTEYLSFNVSTIMELDWDSNIVWQHVEPFQDCHDRARLKNGNTLINVLKPIAPEIQAKVKGGLPGSEINGSCDAYSHVSGELNKESNEVRSGQMYTIVMQEITPDGEIVDEMNLSEVLDPEIDVITAYGGRAIWPGLNSIDETPDGDIISTSYNLSMVYIWDRKNKCVKWRFGDGKDKISFPHDPHVLDNGNVLVFDNGRYHSADPNGKTNYFPPDFSRVIEINPETKEIVWDYRSENPVDFYSTFISSDERLPNGNTLICEGAIGRFFEVTPSGEIVWEYLSPFYSQSGTRYGKTSAVFRAMRYSVDYPGVKGKVFDDTKTDALNRVFGADAMKFANENG